MRAFFLSFVILLGFITSCKEGIDGICSSPFEIQIGPPTIDGDYKVYIVSVKNNNGWWLSGIAVDGNEDDIERRGLEYKESYFIEREYYTFEKVNSSRVIVKLKNVEKKTLKLVVTLQYGNCYGGFTL